VFQTVREQHGSTPLQHPSTVNL